MNVMDEIGDYLRDTKIGSLAYLPHYPLEDKYLQINLRGTKIKIEKGHDIFYYNGYKTASKRNFWYVIFENDLYIEKGFRCYKKAIQSALEKRSKDLRKGLEIVDTMSEKVKQIY